MIQKKLISKKVKKGTDVLSFFSKLVLEGKISSALKYLEESAENNVMEPNYSVIKTLKDLHPSPATIQPYTLLQGPINNMHSSTFNCINEQEVQKAVNKMKGSGGPSLLDAKQWRKILCSKHYKHEGKSLREEIASFARKIATEVLDPFTLEAYTACRLIPLDKAPGETELQIRPIEVGEFLRRIVGKMIGWALRLPFMQ